MDVGARDYPRWQAAERDARCELPAPASLSDEPGTRFEPLASDRRLQIHHGTLEQRGSLHPDLDTGFMAETLDVLVIAKTVATTRFPVEQSSLGGVDRASGRWVRLVPFPFTERDSEPPVRKWSWPTVAGTWQATDPR